MILANGGIKAHTDGFPDPELLTGSLYSTLTHGQEDVARGALLWAIFRERNILDFAESDLISGMGAYSTPCSMDVFAPLPFLGMLCNRISAHIHIGPQSSVPIQQQIDAETATRFLGSAGVIMKASTLLSLTERIRPDFISSPGYFPPGHFIAPHGRRFASNCDTISSLYGGRSGWPEIIGLPLPVEMRIHSWGAHRRAGFFPGRRRDAAHLSGPKSHPLDGRGSGPSPLPPPCG